MMTQEKDKPHRPDPAGARNVDRRTRQAEALRRNLQRRKSQARQRDSGPDDGNAPPDEGC